MFLVNIVLVLVVDMYICSFDISKAFELPLQGLRDIVGNLKWKAFIHHNVNFDIVFLASVVGTALTDLVH